MKNKTSIIEILALLITILIGYDAICNNLSHIKASVFIQTGDLYQFKILKGTHYYFFSFGSSILLFSIIYVIHHFKNYGSIEDKKAYWFILFILFGVTCLLVSDLDKPQAIITLIISCILTFIPIIILYYNLVKVPIQRILKTI